MSTAVQEINDASFKKVIAQESVLVDFYAPWCGPCKIQGTILEGLAAKIIDTKIVKLNVDTSRVAKSFGVSSIPTLILFKHGEPIQQLVGLQTERQLLSILCNS